MKILAGSLAWVLMLITSAADANDKVKERAQRKAFRYFEQVTTLDTIQKAVVAQNAGYPAGASRHDVLPDIQLKDKQWRAWVKKEGAKQGFMEAVMGNACAQRLKLGLVNVHGITEVFVMDKMGATVCTSAPTSDYDQGDEAKWSEVITSGDTHISEPEMDASSKRYQLQVSYPIKEHEAIIGVMTIGVKVY